MYISTSRFPMLQSLSCERKEPDPFASSTSGTLKPLHLWLQVFNVCIACLKEISSPGDNGPLAVPQGTMHQQQETDRPAREPFFNCKSIGLTSQEAILGEGKNSLPNGQRRLIGNPSPPWRLQLSVGQSNYIAWHRAE
ncbi:UNVERIFIED_CONTAM: hypothetical protein Sindi_0508100 [Sesamum indicum]